MEGLRGVAVFLVFLVHYVAIFTVWLSPAAIVQPLSRAIHAIGNTGVDLFFVLSGYLIYGSVISRKQPFLRFMKRRVQRIYPTFAVVFLAYIILSFVFPAENKIPTTPLRALAYLGQNFLLLPGLFPVRPMITVAWSLSYEMFYYLVIPVVVGLLGLRERDISVRVAVFLGIATFFSISCAILGGPIRLVMFIAGILLYETIATNRDNAPGPFTAITAVTFAYIFFITPLSGVAWGTARFVVLALAYFTLCYACFGTRPSILTRTFAWTPLRWLGNMSYSYYLIHGVTLKGVSLWLTPAIAPESLGTVHFIALMLPLFIITLIPAALLFLWVERPFSLSTGRTNNG